MSFVFPGKSGPIFVEGEVSGPQKTFKAKLILDTGATTTSISTKVLRYVGYDPSDSNDIVQLTAGTGSIRVPRVMVNRLTSLGQHAIGLKMAAHDLPPEAGVDGLLGLDFFRGLVLTLDFKQGEISLV